MDEIEEFTHSRRLLSKIFDEEPAATFQFLSTSLDFLPPAIFQAMTIHLWRRRSHQNHTNFILYQNISKLTSMLIVVLHFMFFVWKKLFDRISFLSTFCSFIFNNLRLGLLQNSTNLIFKYFSNAKSGIQNIPQNISTILQLLRSINQRCSQGGRHKAKSKRLVVISLASQKKCRMCWNLNNVM